MKRRALRLALVLAACAPAAVMSQVRVDSPLNKHNLSVSGPGPVKSQTIDEVCVFCHTPHNANPAVPLWNHTMSSGVTYTPYSSSTMVAAVGVPTGSSKLCLSCHDGTVAIGSTVTRGQFAMQGVNAQGALTGPSSLGTNLSDDHPISFVPITGSTITNPPSGSPVQLDANGQVQCRSCHDPHQMDIDATTQKFLVVNNAASGLCVVCHNQPYWATNPSSHRTSTKSYTSAEGAHTGYATVANNGCEMCHRPHTAATPQRALKGVEEMTCGSGGSQCHGASGVGRNIEAEFTKTYSHPTFRTTPSVHDAAESPTNPAALLPEQSSAAARHAECADCHNAHASYASSTTAPKGSGKIAGVWGIDGNGSLRLPNGTPASVNEYEICYKCHADSANQPQPNGTPAPPYPNRVAPQFNMRLMFDPANPSYHPIEAPGRNPTSRSLIAPWTTSSVMYCTDCHDNDQGPKAPTPGTGPAGPHGSSYKHLLAGRYDMDNSSTTESTTTYALCYKCHNRTIIFSDQSFRGHDEHVRGQRASCSICHDPHGVSSTQGNSTNNLALINFDKRFVTPSSSGILRADFTSTQIRCYLTCHGRNHNPESYTR